MSLSPLPDNRVAVSTEDDLAADPLARRPADQEDYIFTSIEADQSTADTRLGIVDDDSRSVKKRYQIGAAAMHVVYLDPEWRVRDDLTV